VHETNQLWNWDVAEVFIGWNFKNIQHYKEFEISPQGEWIDLDINLEKPLHEQGWIWNSGFQVISRVDRGAKVWYGAMRIPMAALDDPSPATGNVFRINLFRSQGPVPHQKEINNLAASDEPFLPCAGSLWLTQAGRARMRPHEAM
jgi:hypothetical protein